MKFIVAAATAAAVLSGSVLAQDLSSLPPCGQTCISNMQRIAVNEFKCKQGDTRCYCCNANFGYGVRDCAQESCSASDATTVIAFGSKYCESAVANGCGNNNNNNGGAGAGNNGNNNNNSSSNKPSSAEETKTAAETTKTATTTAGSEASSSASSVASSASSVASSASSEASASASSTESADGASSTDGSTDDGEDGDEVVTVTEDASEGLAPRATLPAMLGAGALAMLFL